MTKEFLTSTEVFIVKGYLSKDAKKVIPICNQRFVEFQKHAEYIIRFAKAAKGKDFEGKKADSIRGLREEVLAAMSKPSIEFVKSPKVVEKPLSSQLAKEALDFIKFQESKSNVDKINEFLQQFEIINEFEEVGLFWEQEICKIDKIYTMKEIITAVTSVIDLLEK